MPASAETAVLAFQVLTPAGRLRPPSESHRLSLRSRNATAPTRTFPFPEGLGILEGMTEPSFIYRKFWTPILGQLRQGMSPEKLAWSVAAGTTLSTFPILGATTPLCALAGILFKLNHVVLQVMNYLATPLQLAAIPILIHLGENVFGLPHISFNPVRLTNEFRTAPRLFVETYGASALAGIAAWLIFAPFAILAIRALFLPILRRKVREPAPL